MFYRNLLLGALAVSTVLVSACQQERSSEAVTLKSPERVEFQTVTLLRVGLDGGVVNQDGPLQRARLTVKYDEGALVDDFITTMETHGWQVSAPTNTMPATILCAGQLEGKKLQTVICTTDQLGTVVLSYKMDNLVSTQLDVLFEADAMKLLQTMTMPTEVAKE